jgi:hypothetical protein
VNLIPRSTAPVLLVLVLAGIVTACGGSAGTTGGASTAPGAAGAPGTTVATPEPSPTEDPEVLLSPGADTALPRTTQTDTSWGRIWDRLPDDFPLYAGAEPADETSPEPTSGVFAIPGGEPAEIADWFQHALEMATYSTEALSGPLEDGSFVLDSVGAEGCRIEVTVAPLGDTTNVSVRYGADCPNT